MYYFTKSDDIQKSLNQFIILTKDTSYSSSVDAAKNLKNINKNLDVYGSLLNQKRSFVDDNNIDFLKEQINKLEKEKVDNFNQNNVLIKSINDLKLSLSEKEKAISAANEKYGEKENRTNKRINKLKDDIRKLAEFAKNPQKNKKTNMLNDVKIIIQKIEEEKEKNKKKKQEENDDDDENISELDTRVNV